MPRLHDRDFSFTLNDVEVRVEINNAILTFELKKRFLRGNLDNEFSLSTSVTIFAMVIL